MQKHISACLAVCLNIITAGSDALEDETDGLETRTKHVQLVASGSRTITHGQILSRTFTPIPLLYFFQVTPTPLANPPDNYSISDIQIKKFAPNMHPD